MLYFVVVIFHFDTAVVVVVIVHITTKVVSSNPVLGEMYSIQHYLITFVS